MTRQFILHILIGITFFNVSIKNTTRAREDLVVVFLRVGPAPCLGSTVGLALVDGERVSQP